MFKLISIVVYACFLCTSLSIRAESIDDKRSTVSPSHMPGLGEFMHGQGYGKLMIRVVVVGAVPTQGIHYVPEGTDLVFGIMYAGGYTDFSDLGDVTVRRRGVSDLLSFDLEDIIADGDPVPRLVDGDVITIPFSWRKDFQTVAAVAGFITSMTSLVLSILALTRSGN